MRKILFLDVDGVLNTDDDKEPNHVDPFRVALVDEVCEATGAEIVVSSAWRLPYNLGHDGTVSVLRAAGLRSTVTGFTPEHQRFSESLVSAKRHQIRDWLAAHPEVAVWAIVDDTRVSDGPNLVRTDPRRGLTQRDAHRLIEILGTREAP